MAYNTPTAYKTDNQVVSRTISPSDAGATSNSNFVTERIYKGFSSNNVNATFLSKRPGGRQIFECF